MKIFWHEWRQNLKSLLIWSGILGGLTLLFMSLYPSLKSQMAEMSQMYADMGAFSKAFGMDKMGFDTAQGFYGVEAGAMLAIGGSLFAALLGISMLAKEEGGHTAEFLMSHPLGRRFVVFQKIMATLFILLVFNILYDLISILSFMLIKESFDPWAWFYFHLSHFILQVEIAMISLFISALLKKVLLSLSMGLAMGLYFMGILVNIHEKAAFLKYVTPFYFADASYIFTTQQCRLPFLLLSLFISLLAGIFALWVYEKKDLAL